MVRPVRYGSYMSAQEHALVLVKPDGVKRSLIGEIVGRLERKGYEIIRMRMLVAAPALLAEHYAEHAERSFFSSIIEYMSSGPVVALAVAGQRVVEGVRVTTGSTDPTTAPAGTIRGDFGRSWGGDTIENLVHASDSPESAVRELKLWFPDDNWS